LTSSTSTGLLIPNHLLRERYRIINLLGQGGMGAVYRAEDTHLGNRLVAIKEMRQSGMTPQEITEATKAFQSEAYMLAALQHPNLPSIYEHFYDVGLERWYLVMTFIEGDTLEDHLGKARGGRLPVKEVLDIGIQLCTVLGYLHTHRPPIIFRDLKPANVMLTNTGHLYLIDFGIARHFKVGQAKDTIVLGSPGYAAPEQHGKAQTSPRADIYSLGVTLHQLLTGNDPSQTPFRFARLRQYDQSIPPDLEILIMQMLDMDVNKRPPSMASVKQVLQHAAAQQTSMKSPPVIPLQRNDVKAPPNRKDLSTNMDNQFNEASPPPPYQFGSSHTTGHPPDYPSHTTGYPPDYPPPPPPPKSNNKVYLIVIAVLVLLLVGFGVLEAVQLTRPTISPQPAPAAQITNTAPPSNPTSQVTITATPSPTPTLITITKNLDIPCISCGVKLDIKLTTIVIDTSQQKSTWNFTLTNNGTSIDSLDFTTLVLEDNTGQKHQGGGLASTDRWNMSNGQSIPTYATFDVIHGTNYLLTITADYGSYQTETITF
jgi:serine/threonine protein kinase